MSKLEIKLCLDWSNMNNISDLVITIENNKFKVYDHTNEEIYFISDSTMNALIGFLVSYPKYNKTIKIPGIDNTII